MTDEINQEPRYSTRHLGIIFRISESTWGEWRSSGRGPEFHIDPNRRTVFGSGTLQPTIYYRHSSLLEFTGGRWPQGGKFITTRQAAMLLGKTAAAIRKMRQRGKGPEPVYLEGRVRYLPEDL